jgi:uncharacterized SAM-binding protein YcdF (DUF218 family)
LKRILLWSAGLVIGLPLVVGLALGADILSYARQSDPAPADAAIVLGAAVYDAEPTPVFEERLRHAVSLYTSGQVRWLVMTGGHGPGDSLAESEAGRGWAVANGVPADAILVETQSRTTEENFTEALPLLAANGIGRVLVVSDPLHMRRAMRMAEKLGLDAHPSPTPTSRYQSLGTQIPMLAREIYFTAVYWLTGA